MFVNSYAGVTVKRRLVPAEIPPTVNGVSSAGRARERERGNVARALHISRFQIYPASEEEIVHTGVCNCTWKSRGLEECAKAS